jgi:predicted phage gp36 major capsid-like protein
VDAEHGRPHQVDQENHVLTQGGHAVRRESGLADARGNGPQSERVRERRADHEEDLHDIERTGGDCGSRAQSRMEQQAKDQDEPACSQNWPRHLPFMTELRADASEVPT